METIKSISNKRVKDLVSLTKNRRFREETGLFVVEGATLAVEAANSDYLIESVFYTESAYRGYRDEIDAAAAGARTIFLITDQIAKKASSLASPQGILTVLQIKGEAGLDALSGKRRVVVLDRVQDPGNLGAIARSALAFGFDGIAISPDSADRYSDKSLRASMGALLRCDVVVGKTDETISRLKADGFRVYAAALDKEADSADKMVKSGKLAVVIGNEAAGLSSDIIASCDAAVAICTDSRVQSLNAAVAASVLMYCCREGVV